MNEFSENLTLRDKALNSPIHMPGHIPLGLHPEELTRIFHHIRSGESCWLVGVSNTGKSSLLRFLMQEDAKKWYLGDNAEKYLFILLDGNNLSADPDSSVEWRVYELMLNRLLRQIHFSCLSKDIDVLFQRNIHFEFLYRRSIRSKDIVSIQRSLEWLLMILCEQLDYHILFLFDEFDKTLQVIDRQFFLNLKAICGEFKGRVMCLTASRDTLSRLRKDTSEIEVFNELIALNIYGVKPHKNVEIGPPISNVESSVDQVVVKMYAKILIEATGGHLGLLRAALATILLRKNIYRVSKPNLVERLLYDNGVHDECLRIWNDLGEDEREALIKLASGGPASRITQGVLDLLELKGLITSYDNNRSTIFCELFEYFVNRKRILLSDEQKSGLLFDETSSEFIVDGQRISDRELAPLERKLLSYLYQHAGQTCRFYAISEAVWNFGLSQYSDYGASNDMISRVVSTLRKKLDQKSPGAGKRYIISVFKEGYMCVVKAGQSR